MLQAHGLCQTVRRLGHTARFIDYVLPSWRWWREWDFRHGTEIPARALGRGRFKRFRQQYLPLTRPCRNLEDLQETAADLDAVIVGSDQVWNGHISHASIGTYFLDFTDHTPCRRISYAACFGDPQQPPEMTAAVGPLLRRFDHLSVRNEMSARLVREYSGRDAEVVLDPTLLHNYDDLLTGEIRERGYIAAHFLPHEQLHVGKDVLREVKERLQMPVTTTGITMKPVDDHRFLSAGPLEWLRVLRESAFVCTNSFHGTIFAVKFKKPFITWSTESLGGVRGPARLQDFLRICGLEDRLVSAADPAAIEKLLNTPIDYEAVSERLSLHIDRSRAFLEKALGKAPNEQKGD
jgi:hypothetical protein